MTDPRNSDSGAKRGFEAGGSRGANQGGGTNQGGSTGQGGGTSNTGARPQRGTSDIGNRSDASAAGAAGAGMGTMGASSGSAGLGGSSGMSGSAGATGATGTTGTTPAAGRTEQAKEKAQQLATQARDKAGERIESGLQRGKSRAAETLSGIAQSLRQGTSQQNLLGESRGPGHDYVERAAQQVQRAADYLQHTEVDEMVERVESAARRQPALFLGGAFMLGLVGARFLKSSRRNQSQTALTRYDERSAYGGAYRGAYGEAYGGTRGASGSAFLGDRDVTADQEIARETGASTASSAGTGIGMNTGLGGSSSSSRAGTGLDPDGSIDRR